MMKKNIIAALLPLTLIASHSVFAEDTDDVVPVTVNGGTVQFSGSIVNAPCAINIGSGGHSVELGQYRVADFKAAGDVSAARLFNIKLDNCATETYSKASITFNGATVGGNSEALAVNGGATGVGIQILQNDKALKVDGTTASSAFNLNVGDNTLAFQAQYIALNSKVTPGAANATANFTVTYL